MSDLVAANYSEIEGRVMAQGLRPYQVEAMKGLDTHAAVYMGVDLGKGSDRTVHMRILESGKPAPVFTHYVKGESRFVTCPFPGCGHNHTAKDHALPDDILTTGEWPTPLQVRLQEALVLKQKAAPLTEEEFGPKAEEFGQRMIALMHERGGIGLAANQVGLLKQMFIMTLNRPKDGGAGEVVIVCNPILELEGTDEVEGTEGCLSMPGVYEKVWRSRFAFLKYRTPLGEEKAMELEGMEARIAQHEFDHLQGIEFNDVTRMSRKGRKAVEAQWRKLRPLAIADKKGI